MDCLSPVILKNGLAVPCGKCAICRSNIRNEWSIRLAIHLMSCDRMPMFLTFTYSPEFVPLVSADDGIWYRREWPSWIAYNRDDHLNYPTLLRWDMSQFIRKYKRKYGLTNEKFQYFGCGEYGSNTRRPHYHMLFFGDDELYNDFFESVEKAQKRLEDVWHKGFVYVGLAGFDGIHYCTKYCLKEDLEWIPDVCQKPFTIGSNGLGMKFLDSSTAQKWRDQLYYLTQHRDEIYDGMPDFGDLMSIGDAIAYLERYVPSFSLILDDGRKVFLPRPIRRKLVGSFEHFKDSPLWLLQHLRQLRDSMKYYADYGDYDSTHDVNMSYEKLRNRVEVIKKRYLENQYNKHLIKL